jgi:hypothetical protein
MSGMSVEINAFHRYVTVVANLEGPEEDLLQKTHQLKSAYLAGLLSGQQQQYACFNLNVVQLENAVVQQYIFSHASQKGTLPSEVDTSFNSLMC